VSKIRSVIFDCYSTLVDIQTNEEKVQVFDYLSLYLRYYGASISSRKLKSAVHHEKARQLKASQESYPEVDLETVFNIILKKEGLGNGFLAGSCCKLFRLLSRERFQVFPDSLPVLSEMKDSGYPLAVVSDAQKAFCLEEGEMLGLNKYFDRIILSTHFGFTKPDPRLFAIACAMINVPPEDGVYIGNDPDRDVKGARQAGMRVILLERRGKGMRRPTEPDFRASNLWEAWQWIKGRA
jgi:putative hydrolase of the HAD superfamily